MGLINKLYTYATTPGIDPNIGAKLDAEIGQILNLVNGYIDDANISGNPDIATSKLVLTSTGFLSLTGGDLTGAIWHKLSTVLRKGGAGGTVGYLREYQDVSGTTGAVWGICYNTAPNGAGGWLGRDIADVCMRLEFRGANADLWGDVRYYFAPYAGGGVTPTWNNPQHFAPMGGTGELGDVTISADPAVSGIFHYKNLTINSGVTWTLQQGKPLIIFARESVTINGIIEGQGKGALGSMTKGGIGSIGGVSSGGGGGGGVSLSGGNGGACTYLWESITGGTGSAPTVTGGAGNVLTNTKRLSIDVSYIGGSGGGAGNGGAADSAGAGGDGGGIIYIESPRIIVGTTGIIRASGNNGGNASATSYGGGGGGGGGAVHIRGKSYTNSGTVVAAGGGAGTGLGVGASGGAGGAGVVYIEELK